MLYIHILSTYVYIYLSLLFIVYIGICMSVYTCMYACMHMYIFPRVVKQTYYGVLEGGRV